MIGISFAGFDTVPVDSKSTIPKVYPDPPETIFVPVIVPDELQVTATFPPVPSPIMSYVFEEYPLPHLQYKQF